MFYLLLLELSLLIPSAFAQNAEMAKHIRKSVDDFLPNCDIIVFDPVCPTGSENMFLHGNFSERAKFVITTGGKGASLVEVHFLKTFLKSIILSQNNAFF